VLQKAGHNLIGVDVTFTLARAANSNRPPISVVVADAARLPFRDRAADLVVAFMSLQDVDDFAGAVHEAARVLEPGGRFCLAIPHPVGEAGDFQEDGTFVLDRSYFGVWRYPDIQERDGGEVAFHSEHRPIEAYGLALEQASFLIEAFREPLPDVATAAGIPNGERSRQVPSLLMIRARLG
jgi:SAM-dependent methyltransferase